MIRFYYILPLILLLSSCSQNEDIIEYQIRIAGKVDKEINYSNDFELFKDNIGYSSYVEISADVDSNGYFDLLFDSELTQDISIGISDHYESLIVHPGDSIFINIRATEDKGIQFTYNGDNDVQNQILSIFQIGYDSIVDSDSIYWNRKFYSGNQYKMYCNNVFNNLIDFKTTFFKKYNLPNEYKLWIENEIVGNYYNWLLIYPNDHLLMNRLSYKIAYNLDYFDFCDSIPKISANDLVNTEISRRLPNLILGFYIRALVDSRNDWNPKINNRDSLIINEILKYAEKDNLLSQMMLNEFINWGLKRLDTILYSQNLLLIDSFITNEYYNNALKSKYAEAKQILESQKIDASAKRIDWTKKDVLSLIDSIKARGENKIIYIDVWATWCGPCRSAMPSSYNLQNRFKDEPVDFVYICVDSEKKSWNDFVSKFRLGGFHYYLTKSQSKILREQLKVKGIPHYILLDKNGNHIKSDVRLSPDVAKKEIQKILG